MSIKQNSKLSLWHFNLKRLVIIEIEDLDFPPIRYALRR